MTTPPPKIYHGTCCFPARATRAHDPSARPPPRPKILTRKVVPIKATVHKLIIERLKGDLALFLAAAKKAHEAATHEENIPDNKYDTLSLEASYVAQGQANRAQELKASLHEYQTMALQEFDDDTPIRLSALVELEAEDGEERAVFIGPREGGLKLQLQGREVMVITPASPLGAQLIGKSTGDSVSIGERSFEVTAVS